MNTKELFDLATTTTSLASPSDFVKNVLKFATNSNYDLRYDEDELTQLALAHWVQLENKMMDEAVSMLLSGKDKMLVPIERLQSLIRELAMSSKYLLNQESALHDNYSIQSYLRGMVEARVSLSRTAGIEQVPA